MNINPSNDRIIAIIDNNFLLRRYLERLLAAAGYATESFASADEFLAEIAVCRPLCLVLDIELRDSSGLILARHPAVLALHCPIVFTSGTINEALEREARELGGTALVRRPFKAIELLSAIAKATTAER